MAVPKIRKAKAPPPITVKLAALNRKCRACGRWSTVRGAETCPWCGAAYGRLELGTDLPGDVAPAVDAKGFPIPKAEL